MRIAVSALVFASLALAHAAEPEMWPAPPPRPAVPLPELLFPWSTPAVTTVTTNEDGVVVHRVSGVRTADAADLAVRAFLRAGRLDFADREVGGWTWRDPPRYEAVVNERGSRFRREAHRFLLAETNAPVRRVGEWSFTDDSGRTTKGDIPPWTGLREGPEDWLPPNATGILVTQEETLPDPCQMRVEHRIARRTFANGSMHGLSYFWTLGADGCLAEDEYVGGERVVSRIWLEPASTLFLDSGAVLIEEAGGNVDGQRLFWDREGRLKRLQTFRQGFAHGVSLELASDGSISKCSYFDRGVLLRSIIFPPPPSQ